MYKVHTLKQKQKIEGKLQKNIILKRKGISCKKVYKTGINNSSEKFAAKWRNGAVTGGDGRVIKAVIDHGF